MPSIVWDDNRGGRGSEGEAEEVRFMCGGGERRTGKGTNERLAKEEDEMGKLEIQNLPSFSWWAW